MKFALTVPWLLIWYSKISPEEHHVTKILSAPNLYVQEEMQEEKILIWLMSVVKSELIMH